MLMREYDNAAKKEIVRYAAGTAIRCPGCGEVLDAPTTVVASQDDGPVLVLCSACWGRAPMLGKWGSVEVLDGRVLFAPKRRTREWRLRD